MGSECIRSFCASAKRCCSLLPLLDCSSMDTDISVQRRISWHARFPAHVFPYSEAMLVRCKKSLSTFNVAVSNYVRVAAEMHRPVSLCAQRVL